MNTILSFAGIDRNMPKVFDTYVTKREDIPAEPGVLVIEPSFLEFKAASNNELGAPYMAVQQGAKSYDTVVVMISYTAENARLFKGYVAELADFMRNHGFVDVKTMHVPFEAYGSPMAGSSLMLVGKRAPFELVLKKGTVYPSQVFKGMVYHSKTGKGNYRPVAGSLASAGAYQSHMQLLPNIRQWGSKALVCEYKEGTSLSIGRMKNSDLGRLFGTRATHFKQGLTLCTPAEVLNRVVDAVA